MANPTLLILYAEIMPYNLATFKELIEQHPNHELHIVCWGNSKKLTRYEAPQLSNIFYYNKEQYSYEAILELYKKINPILILISGRMEKDYLKIALVAKKDKKIVVGTSDNHYTNSWKQKLAIFFSNMLYKRYFNYMLVPGLYQYEYQRRLGFKKNQIIFPQYCADTKLFEKAYALRAESQKTGILFLGRLNKVKGIELLVQTHKKLYLSHKIKDKLIVIGDGQLKDELELTNDFVQYHPFKNQEDLIEILKSVKYFCLPSIHEPWGVVIHEAASAGLPIVTTTSCGAATAFVKQGYNGYVFEANNQKELEKILIKMDALSQDEINIMGKRSFELSKQIQPEMWYKSLLNLIN